MSQIGRASRRGASPDDPFVDTTGLLRALWTAYGSGDEYHGTFDEYSIAANSAYERPGLLQALAAAGLKPRLTSRHGFLTRPAVARVRQWLERAEGHEIDGLRLTRDRIGWYEFTPGERA